jgi:hypothetical protein
VRRIQREGGLKKYDQEYPGGVCRGVAFTYSLDAYCSLRSEWCTNLVSYGEPSSTCSTTPIPSLPKMDPPHAGRFSLPKYKRKTLQIRALHNAYGLLCGSKSTAVFGTTAPKPSTNLRELILTFIQPQKSVLGGSSFQVRDRSGVSPGPKRKQSVLREDFARSHQDVLVCMVFFTTKVLTLETANGGKTKNRIRPVRDDSKACEIDSSVDKGRAP